MEEKRIARNEGNKIERGIREAVERFWNACMEDLEMAGLANSEL